MRYKYNYNKNAGSTINLFVNNYKQHTNTQLVDLKSSQKKTPFGPKKTNHLHNTLVYTKI